MTRTGWPRVRDEDLPSSCVIQPRDIHSDAFYPLVKLEETVGNQAARVYVSEPPCAYREVSCCGNAKPLTIFSGSGAPSYFLSHSVKSLKSPQSLAAKGQQARVSTRYACALTTLPSFRRGCAVSARIHALALQDTGKPLAAVGVSNILKQKT